MEDLPREIMDDIFLRLPVKSLLQCRCVSKLWCNIIDDPSLANMHQTQASDQEPPLLFGLTLDNKSDELDLYELEDNCKNLSLGKIPLLNFVSKNFDIGTEAFNLESICNGLLCFANFSTVILSNPLRQEILMLPEATNQYPVTNIDKYGLGFDTSTNTYKVVHVFCKGLDYNTMRYKFGSEVYTLGSTSKSWREISSIPPYPLCLWRRSVYANESIHWIVDTSLHNDNLKGMIVSFDIGKEEFHLTPHPVDIDIYTFGVGHLIHLKGDLAIVETGSHFNTIVIWVLKDWNNIRWVREFTIHRCISLVCPSDPGLIYEVGGIVYNCNLKNDEQRWCQTRILTNSERTLLKIISFKGSLISLKNFGKLM